MSGAVEAKLAELGPDAARGRAAAGRVPAGRAVRACTCTPPGQLPDGGRQAAGHRQGRRRGHARGGQGAGRTCALNALAAVKSVAGDLDRIARVVKVVGFVASASDFTGQPAVINGASELLGAVLGDKGVHARSAVGVAVLPLDAPVEVEIQVELVDGA